MKKLAIALGILTLLSMYGCSDQYDGLKVVDGNGRVLKLQHRIGQVYFVRDVSTLPPAPNAEINKKLNEKMGSK